MAGLGLLMTTASQCVPRERWRELDRLVEAHFGAARLLPRRRLPAERGDQGLIEEPFVVDVSRILTPEALGTQSANSSTQSGGRTGVLGLRPRA